MTAAVFWGIFSFGFVFGYLLYYAVRHTEKFSIELLSSAIGAIGSGTVIGLLGKVDGWIGPYGIGIGAGFGFYLALSLVLLFTGKLTQAQGGGLLFRNLSQNLLGYAPPP